jgi:hypothetical protein
LNSGITNHVVSAPGDSGTGEASGEPGTDSSPERSELSGLVVIVWLLVVGEIVPAGSRRASYR